MSGHTPGPWRTAATDDTLVLAGGAIQIASAYDRFGDIEETDANARLIAAAPDLVERGEAMLIAFAEGVDWTPDQHATYEAFAAAIALATGGSPNDA